MHTLSPLLFCCSQLPCIFFFFPNPTIIKTHTRPTVLYATRHLHLHHEQGHLNFNKLCRQKMSTGREQNQPNFKYSDCINKQLFQVIDSWLNLLHPRGKRRFLMRINICLLCALLGATWQVWEIKIVYSRFPHEASGNTTPCTVQCVSYKAYWSYWVGGYSECDMQLKKCKQVLFFFLSFSDMV